MPKPEDMSECKDRIELFKTLATFGFASAALFCVGGLVPLMWSSALSACARLTIAGVGGAAGLSIIVAVMVFYCRLTGLLRNNCATNQPQ